MQPGSGRCRQKPLPKQDINGKICKRNTSAQNLGILWGMSLKDVRNILSLFAILGNWKLISPPNMEADCWTYITLLLSCTLWIDVLRCTLWAKTMRNTNFNQKDAPTYQMKFAFIMLFNEVTFPPLPPPVAIEMARRGSSKCFRFVPSNHSKFLLQGNLSCLKVTIPASSQGDCRISSDIHKWHC